MLSAILTTIAALIVLGVLAVVIFRVRSQSSQSRTRDRMQVKSVTSVGISAQTPKLRQVQGRVLVWWNFGKWGRPSKPIYRSWRVGCGSF